MRCSRRIAADTATSRRPSRLLRCGRRRGLLPDPGVSLQSRSLRRLGLVCIWGMWVAAGGTPHRSRGVGGVPGSDAGSSCTCPRVMGDAMNSGACLGLALAAGYLLGRFHKMKWALGLAALAGGRRLPGGPGGLVQQGAKLLTSSPEVTKLTDEMKGRLVDAGKAAAVAAVSSKINSLGEGLRERSDAMRDVSAGGTGGAAAGCAEDVKSERDLDEDRAYDSGRKRHPDDDDDSRDHAERVPAPRSESDRAPVSRGSRSRERPAADDRRDHPSRHDVEGNSPHRESAGSRPRRDGPSRPRSTTSGTGSDSE